MNNKLGKGWVSKAKKLGRDAWRLSYFNQYIHIRKIIGAICAQKNCKCWCASCDTYEHTTKNNENKLSYYFSLRRLNENYNARELAQYCMGVTGSKIGVGHPWGSGVNLNGEQQMKFMDKFQ